MQAQSPIKRTECRIAKVFALTQRAHRPQSVAKRKRLWYNIYIFACAAKAKNISAVYR